MNIDDVYFDADNEYPTSDDMDPLNSSYLDDTPDTISDHSPSSQMYNLMYRTGCNVPHKLFRESGRFCPLYSNPICPGEERRILLDYNGIASYFVVACQNRRATGSLSDSIDKVVCTMSKYINRNSKIWMNSDYRITLTQVQSYHKNDLLVVGCQQSISVCPMKLQCNGLNIPMSWQPIAKQFYTSKHGQMYVNRIVDIAPSVGQYLCNETVRRISDLEKWFLCPVFTPMAATGGLMRCLVSDVTIRVISESTLESLSLISRAIATHQCNNSMDHLIEFDCRTYEVCRCCIMICWHSYNMFSKSSDVITLHWYTGERKLQISYCSGTLMRKDASGDYADSIMVNYTGKNYHPVYPPMSNDLSSLFSSWICMIPYQYYNVQPRHFLAPHFYIQAVSHDVSSFNSIAKSESTEIPIVTTRSMEAMRRNIPGLNVIVCVANTPYTYEDAFMMSETCANRFRYSCITNVRLDLERTGTLNVGDIIEPNSHSWWKVPFTGIVCRVSVLNSYVKVSIKRTVPAVSGDKFATCHGQKGVITVIPDDRMPITPLGRSELVIGSTTMIKRGTYGQLLEMAAGAFARVNNTRVLVDNGPLHDPNNYICPFAYSETELANNYSPFNTRCNYGVIRLMHLAHFALDKLHYTSNPQSEHGINPSSGRLQGGSVRIGEMEIQQMIGSGLTNCLSELKDRGDMIKTNYCSMCKSITIFCFKECTNKSYDSIVIPHSMIIAMSQMYVSSNIRFNLGIDPV